jgi:hypothetical protein
VADDGWDEQVGSVAEEAQRLLESLRAGGGPEPRDDATPPGEGSGPGVDDPADETWVCTDPFCRSCPLCRTVAVVRGLSPETLRRLADLATVAAGVLADLAGERAAAPPRGGEAAGGRRPQGDAARRPTPSVRPIPVRDADGDAADA